MNGKQADRTWRKYNLQCCDRDDCNSSGMPHLMWQDTPLEFGTSSRSNVRGAKIAAQTSRKDKAIRLGDFYTEKDTILNITRMHSAEQQGAHEAAHAYANSVWRKRGFEGRAPEAQVVFDALSRSGALHSIKAEKEALRTISWYASKDKSANGYREAFAEAISKTITKGESASLLARAIYKGAKSLQ